MLYRIKKIAGLYKIHKLLDELAEIRYVKTSIFLKFKINMSIFKAFILLGVEVTSGGRSAV